MKTYIVDAFTDRAFAGNPAGVCLVDEPLSDATMLRIAQELGHSETAFVAKRDADSWSIRFFSPAMEIPLCGHATLGSARVLFELGAESEVRFVNVQDLVLSAVRADDGITMELPVYTSSPASVPPALVSALGLTDVVNVEYNAETKILLLETASTRELAQLTPDFAALRAAHDDINGVLVTAPSHDDDYDFHSRYFWPWSGTNEDPVTGGTHTFLAPYWAQRLGKQHLRSYQSSARGGFMALEVKADRLLVTSQAQLVFAGELLV